tara:strand:- start:196 stop:489 length:294 start_codon:yes stop_codon:yes gene_type:complete
MEWEQLAIIAQIVTGIATLAVAMFLASQLWQQHRDSVMSLRLTIGTQVDDMNRSMYTNRDFASIFLLGCEDSGLRSASISMRIRLLSLLKQQNHPSE